MALSILSAVIVLGSFLVKDVSQDASKDRIDSLESARNAYQEANARESLNQGFDVVGVDLCELATDTPALKQVPKFCERMDNNQWRSLTTRSSNLRDFLGKLRSEKELTEKYKGFEQQIEKYQKQLVVLYAGSVAPSFIESAKAMSDLSLLEAEMSGTYETEQGVNRMWFRIYKFGSYALFLIGWVLGLSGKVFHVPGLGAEE